NVITKLSVGGAQETALRYCSLLDPLTWDTSLVAGPESSPEGDLFDEAARQGVRVLTIPTLCRRARPLADFRAVVDLVRLFRRERPDVVHTHSSKAGLAGRLAARLAGVPVIVHTVHGWSFHDGMSRAGRRTMVTAERIAARWTTTLVVVAERDAEIGRAAGVGRPEQYALVRSGIDTVAFRSAAATRAAARQSLGIPEGVPVVGTVTRLCRQKDPATLLHAARSVVDARPDARLVVVGDGPLRAEVETLLDDLSLRPHVTMLGPRDDVAALLAGFDAFVLSSRWEGLPRVVVEAMAVGVPVVSTNVGGVGEAIEDGVSGLLGPIGDPDALAAAILRILDEPGLGDRLRRAAGANVDEFDLRVMTDRLDDLYTRLLGGRSRPRRRRMAAAVRTDTGHEAA
ncbi:MAG TPA: glycosyltransferase family 4 protein, partial [Acidimicrobiales bacterium]|nr:glycosyltransferase family 4 protein [Acidimicrobiales bacterium]